MVMEDAPKQLAGTDAPFVNDGEILFAREMLFEQPLFVKDYYVAKKPGERIARTIRPRGDRP